MDLLVYIAYTLTPAVRLGFLHTATLDVSSWLNALLFVQVEEQATHDSSTFGATWRMTPHAATWERIAFTG